MSTLLTGTLGLASQTSEPASVAPLVIEEPTENPVGGGCSATICQPALADALRLSRIALTTNECPPIARPVYVTGLVHDTKLAPSRLHLTLFASFATKATVALVLVVGLAGLLVIVTVGAANAAPVRAWARATASVPARTRQIPRTVPTQERRRARGAWGELFTPIPSRRRPRFPNIRKKSLNIL